MDLSAGGPEDEHAVGRVPEVYYFGFDTASDQAAYDEFYGRLCVLRHDRNTFAAMLKEMQKRMQKDQVNADTFALSSPCAQVNHDKYSPIVTDLTRLLKLMKNKTAQSNSMPLDGPDLLVRGLLVATHTPNNMTGLGARHLREIPRTAGTIESGYCPCWH